MSRNNIMVTEEYIKWMESQPDIQGCIYAAKMDLEIPQLYINDYILYRMTVKVLADLKSSE